MPLKTGTAALDLKDIVLSVGTNPSSTGVTISTVLKNCPVPKRLGNGLSTSTSPALDGDGQPASC